MDAEIDSIFPSRDFSVEDWGVYEAGRLPKTAPAQYEFPSAGMYRIACKVQDDMGGEGMWTGEIEVK